MNTENLRDTLLASRESLQERLSKIKKHIRHSETEIERDFAEQAVQRENDEVVSELSENLQQNLSEINDALERMDKGNYGICFNCGDMISEERLEAVPYTLYCRKCIQFMPGSSTE